MTRINSLTDLPEDCKELLGLCELIWDIEDANVQEIRERIIKDIDQSIVSERLIVKILNSVFINRTKRMKPIADLLQLLTTKDNLCLKEKFYQYCKEIKTILILRKCIQGEIPEEYTDKTEEDIFNVYESGSLENAIVWDNFEELQKIHKLDGIKFDTEKHKMSILSFAASWGSVSCFKYLVMNGEKVTQEDYENAFTGNSREIIDMLKEQFQITNKCIDNAVLGHHNNLVNEIMEQYNLEYSWATCLNHYNLPCYFSKLFKVIYVDYKDIYQDSALTSASKFGLVPIVRLLIETEHSNIEQVNRYEQTPLLCAAENNFVGVMKVLLEKNAKVDVKDVYKRTPLISASNFNSIDAVKLLIHHGAKVDSVDELGNSPLHIACANGSDDLVKFLLENGANIELKNNDGLTPLWVASSSNSIGCVEILLDHNADAEAKNAQGWTPLMIASQFNRADIVKLLVEHKANVEYSTESGETSMEIARKFGSKDVFNLLTDKK